MNFEKIKTLIFDIDGTLITYKNNLPEVTKIKKEYGALSLFFVLEKCAEEIFKIKKSKLKKLIRQVCERNPWWTWEQLFNTLNIKNEIFWEYALKIETEYLQPASPHTSHILYNLYEEKYKLYIATNNHFEAAIHKLKITGLKQEEISEIFLHIFNAQELKHYKWESDFWNIVKKNLTNPENSAVVGDNFCDDYQIPVSAGLGHSFLISQKKDKKFDKLTFISGIHELSEKLKS